MPIDFVGSQRCGVQPNDPASLERMATRAASAAAKKAAPATKQGSRKAAAKKRPTRKAASTSRTASGNVVTPAVWDTARSTEELAKALGGVTALARALGVSPSQPSRWRSGKESPGPEAARRLIDLHHVVARAQLVWHPDVIPMWLTSANAFLNGQTPLGVLVTRGPSEVLDALDAFDAGGFA